MSENPGFSVSVKLLENYIFQVDFGDFGYLVTDEPEPLGNSEGPNPARLLAASVVNCLAASLLFAIRKQKGEPGDVTATINGKLERVEKRWRIVAMQADLHLPGDPDKMPNLDKALAQFEDFCVVTQSVKAGIDVAVNVFDRDGKKLH